MSRHNVPAKNPKHKVIVGWDHPLMTYFVQVTDLTKTEEEDFITKTEEEDFIILWAGCSPRELYEIEQLEQCVRPYATLSRELKVTLYGDQG